MYCVFRRSGADSLVHRVTRSKVVQTQEIFHRLVKGTIIQDDPVKAIFDMRLAIKNTNVVLNMAITPGIILLTSDMIILNERVAGYNNVLTLEGYEVRC